MGTIIRTLPLLLKLPKASIINVAVRTISTSSARSSLVRMKQNQALFQVDDGKPVYLKAGFRDRVLYLLTVGLALFGLLMNVTVIYTHAKPVSWRGENVC